MTIRAASVLTLLAGLLLPPPAQAQGWTATASAGQTVFDPVGAGIGTAHLAGSVRYDAVRDAWVSGMAAAPVHGDDPFWTLAGAGVHLPVAAAPSAGTTFGIQLTGYGYVFRDRLQSATGTGGTLEIMPTARVRAGRARLDLRAGWRGHTLSYTGLVERQGVIDTAARASYGRAVRVGADARVVRAAGLTFPYLGGTLGYSGSALEMWAAAGRWLSDTLDEVTWQAGAGYRPAPRVILWTSVRQDGPDPLYWNTARRSWSAGVTTQLGRARAGSILPTHPAGLVVFRVPVADAPGPSLALAGSFNGWQPVAMAREGSDWVVRLPIDAGVHRYAFRDANGRWFVPASIAGRRSDGMGGEVALLVVDP